MNNTTDISKQTIQTNALAYQQRGAVLLTSLLMLIIFTIIGLSGIQTTIIEEKMANNYRDHELAFQSAESALVFGEKMIEQYFTENATGSDTVLWKNYLLKETTIHNCSSVQSENSNLKGTCGPYEKDNGVITEFDPFATDAWNNAPTITGTNTDLIIRATGANRNLQPPKYIIKLVRKDDSTGSYIFNVFAKGWGDDTDAVAILRSTYIKK